MKNELWPNDDTVAPSVAHKVGMNHYGAASYPDGLVPWTAARAPDLTCGHSTYTTGRLRSCGYCGSMHPADVAAAIKAGAKVSWADRKYGWPHKVYVDGIKNPWAGMANSTTSTGYGSKKDEIAPRDAEYIESRGGRDNWVQLANWRDLQEKKPEFVTYSWHQKGTERPTTMGKFYTMHLMDASPEDRAVIERAMGLHFDLERLDGKIAWWPFGTERPQQLEEKL